MNRHLRIEQIISAVSTRRALACVTVFAALLLCGTAHATVTTKKAMWGPAVVDGVSQFPIYEDLGVGVWQSSLSWDQIATRRPDRPGDPSDPA
jgi:hypothetical protein